MIQVVEGRSWLRSGLHPRARLPVVSPSQRLRGRGLVAEAGVLLDVTAGLSLAVALSAGIRSEPAGFW